jgi:hypothetical protein
MVLGQQGRDTIVGVGHLHEAPMSADHAKTRDPEVGDRRFAGGYMDGSARHT